MLYSELLECTEFLECKKTGKLIGCHVCVHGLSRFGKRIPLTATAANIFPPDIYVKSSIWAGELVAEPNYMNCLVNKTVVIQQ